MKNKINKQLLLVIALLILTITIIVLIYTKKELQIDILAYNIIVEKLRTPSLTKIMKIITMLGNANIIITICLLTSILIFKNHKQLALIIPLNLIIVTCANQLIKQIIKRPRPFGYRLIEIGGYSFPSGHAMVGLAFYGLYLYIINKIIQNRKLKLILNITVITIIILIGISRIYLGVHYLSDILVGYFISAIYLLIITKILDKYTIK